MSTLTRFSLADYNHMIDCGAFAPPHDRRCELIRGEIRDMSPIGTEHGELVSYLNDWSHDVTSRDVVRIRIQDAIEIPELDSAPQPDVVWAPSKSYARQRPQAAEVMLLIEVAGSSLRDDLGEKATLYAEAGIAYYWVVDLPGRRVHIHRQPTRTGFASIKVAEAGRISPLCAADVELDVAALFDQLC